MKIIYSFNFLSQTSDIIHNYIFTNNASADDEFASDDF